jgi:hypothetical protein
MFSSNQILQVSGCIEHKNELKHALEFALNASGWIAPMTRAEKPCKCVYQITSDGRYCIGWGGSEHKGWNEFPFDFDVDIISQIIAKHLSKQKIVRDMWDGSYHAGFLMKSIEFSFSDEDNGIKKPSYGIVSFEPYTCFYSK